MQILSHLIKAHMTSSVTVSPQREQENSITPFNNKVALQVTAGPPGSLIPRKLKSYLLNHQNSGYPLSSFSLGRKIFQKKQWI